MVPCQACDGSCWCSVQRFFDLYAPRALAMAASGGLVPISARTRLPAPPRNVNLGNPQHLKDFHGNVRDQYLEVIQVIITWYHKPPGIADGGVLVVCRT